MQGQRLESPDSAAGLRAGIKPMSRWTGWMVVALVTGMASASQGQMGGMMSRGANRGSFQNFGTAGSEDGNKKPQVCPIRVTSADGKTTNGTLRVTTVVVACSLGVYEIKPEKVQEIKLDPHSPADPGIVGPSGMQRKGSIITNSGKIIEGTVLIPSWWRVETDLGSLTLSSTELQSIQFTHDASLPPASNPLEPIPAPRPSP